MKAGLLCCEGSALTFMQWNWTFAFQNVLSLFAQEIALATHNVHAFCFYKSVNI